MREVTFNVSTGYVGSKREETFKLIDLGIIEDEYTKEELEDVLNEAFENWLWNNIDAGWDFEE